MKSLACTVDWIFIIFFAINLLFITPIVDFEQLAIPSYEKVCGAINTFIPTPFSSFSRLTNIQYGHQSGHAIWSTGGAKTLILFFLLALCGGLSCYQLSHIHCFHRKVTIAIDSVYFFVCH